VKGSSLISIKTTVPNQSYPNAGIEINSSSYSLAAVGTECIHSNDTGYCVFSVSDTQPKDISISGTGDTLNLTLCLNGTGKTSSCQNYSVSMVITKPRFAYFNNQGSAAVYVCALSQSTGLITSCQDAGFGDLMGSGTLGITLNSTRSTAYITYEDLSTSNMFQCAINPIDGTFNTCSEISIAVIGSPSNPYVPEYGMPALSADNSTLYLVDSNGTGRVLACSIADNVISSECTDTGATNISDLSEGISLIKIGSTTYAYIGNGYTNDTMTVCTVNGDVFTNCIAKSGGGAISSFDSPILAAFNPAGTIAYISDYDKGVYGCSTTPNNTAHFDNCFIAWDATSPTPLPIDPYGVSINRKGTMAYISGYSSDVYQCPILSNGVFGTCTTSTAVPTAVTNVLGY